MSAQPWRRLPALFSLVVLGMALVTIGLVTVVAGPRLRKPKVR